MRSLALTVLTIASLSSNAFAEKALIVNCAFETNLTAVATDLKGWATAPTVTGVEVANAAAGMAKAQAVLQSSSMDPLKEQGQTYTVLEHAKILFHVGPTGDNFKNVCVVLKGDVVQREPVK